MHFNNDTFRVQSIEIEQMDCGWLGPHSSIIRLKMPDSEFERVYKEYVGNQGWSADVKVSVKLLEGEDPIVLENGYVAECDGKEVLIAIDLPNGTAEEFGKQMNFRDYVVSEDIRKEEIQKAESKKPHLQRFRIAMEED